MQATIDHLRALSLVVESSGGRVMRYAHNVERVLGVPSQSVALLAALMLRGPQTAGELRINCRAPASLRRHLGGRGIPARARRARRRARSWWSCRASPARARRAGCTCFPARPRSTSHAGAAAPSTAATMSSRSREIAALKANVAHLQNELAGVKATVAKLCAELGIGGA